MVEKRRAPSYEFTQADLQEMVKDVDARAAEALRALGMSSKHPENADQTFTPSLPTTLEVIKYAKARLAEGRKVNTSLRMLGQALANNSEKPGISGATAMRRYGPRP